MTGEIERENFAADAEKAAQPLCRLDKETQEQVGERALLAAEFRKVASQLGELRRRETHLQRRIALLEIERRQGQALPEAQLAESAHSNPDLPEAKSAEIASLNAQLKDAITVLQLLKASTSWKLTQPLRWFVENFRWSVQQLERVLRFSLRGKDALRSPLRGFTFQRREHTRK